MNLKQNQNWLCSQGTNTSNKKQSYRLKKTKLNVIYPAQLDIHVILFYVLWDIYLYFIPVLYVVLN